MIYVSVVEQVVCIEGQVCELLLVLFNGRCEGLLLFMFYLSFGFVYCYKIFVMVLWDCYLVKGVVCCVLLGVGCEVLEWDDMVVEYVE